MDSQQRHRQIERERVTETSTRVEYGSRQFVLNMDRETYDAIWSDTV